MKLLTKEIAAKLVAADTEAARQRPADRTPVVVKFFTPWANATWMISSGTPVDGNGEPCDPADATDWHLFGHCNLGDPTCAELGYVMLSDLSGLRGPAGLKIERDLYTSDLGTLQDAIDACKRQVSGW